MQKKNVLKRFMTLALCGVMTGGMTIAPVLMPATVYAKAKTSSKKTSSSSKKTSSSSSKKSSSSSSKKLSSSSSKKSSTSSSKKISSTSTGKTSSTTTSKASGSSTTSTSSTVKNLKTGVSGIRYIPTSDGNYKVETSASYNYKDGGNISYHASYTVPASSVKSSSSISTSSYSNFKGIKRYTNSKTGDDSGWLGLNSKKSIESQMDSFYYDWYTPEGKRNNSSYGSSSSQEYSNPSSGSGSSSSNSVQYNKSTNTKVSSDSNREDKIDAYVAEAKEMGDNDSIGYSQTTRYLNPNVDCSTFVYYSLVNSGVVSKKDLGKASDFNTRTMGSQLIKAGFEEVKVTSSTTYEKGDILVTPGDHTVIVSIVDDNGSITKIDSAHRDRDGKDGDSTGKEVNRSNNYGTYSVLYRLPE